MKRILWTIVALVALGAAVYVSIFPLAEIYTEVVILRTWDAEGEPHDTRVTIIDIDGAAWVRGRPYRGWFRRIEANPAAELYRAGTWRPVEAVVSRDASDAAAFQQAMLDTYGLLYRYLDFIAQMSAHELPVRLDPRDAKQALLRGDIPGAATRHLA